MATTLTVDNFNFGAGLIYDRHVNSSAAIDADKMQHAYEKGTNFATAIGGTPATREEIIHIASQAGTIRNFKARLADTGTSTDIDFDLEVNGVSVLSAAVNITHSDSDGTTKSGTISSASFSAGDVITLVMTVTSSTGAQGAYAQVAFEENTAP
ncbi:MAG: hypothetical protein VW362_09900 [Candidatus Nanopelagicales bacterium]